MFGNHLLEKSVAVYCETAEAHYHTMEVSNVLTWFVTGNKIFQPRPVMTMMR